jgi:plasmid stability protein
MNDAQILLPQALHEELKLRARRAGMQADELARELLERDLYGNRERRGLRQLAKLGIKGPKDFASHLDNYLYGDKH